MQNYFKRAIAVIALFAMTTTMLPQTAVSAFAKGGDITVEDGITVEEKDDITIVDEKDKDGSYLVDVSEGHDDEIVIQPEEQASDDGSKEITIGGDAAEDIEVNDTRSDEEIKIDEQASDLASNGAESLATMDTENRLIVNVKGDDTTDLMTEIAKSDVQCDVAALDGAAILSFNSEADMKEMADTLESLKSVKSVEEDAEVAIQTSDVSIGEGSAIQMDKDALETETEAGGDATSFDDVSILQEAEAAADGTSDVLIGSSAAEDVTATDSEGNEIFYAPDAANDEYTDSSANQDAVSSEVADSLDASESIAQAESLADTEDSNISVEEALEDKTIIALIDTGVNGIDNIDLTGEGDGDANGHGTRMAGEMQSIIGDKKDIKILSIKAIGENGRGNLSNIYAAVQVAIDNHVDIINMSFVMNDNDNTSAVREIIKTAQDAGIKVIAAAGNQGSDASCYFPANADDVITVGAADADGKVRDLSNTGKLVEWYAYAQATSDATAKASALYAVNGKLETIDGTIWAAEDVKSGEDIAIEDSNYILEHADKKYVGEGKELTLMDSIMVNHLLVDASSISEEAAHSIDVFWENEDAFEHTFGDYNSFQHLYEVSEDSDYYVGYASVLESESSPITDWSTCLNNDMAEVVDDIIFDNDTNLVYVPKHYLGLDKETGKHNEFTSTRMQLMYAVANADAIDFDMMNNRVSVGSSEEVEIQYDGGTLSGSFKFSKVPEEGEVWNLGASLTYNYGDGSYGELAGYAYPAVVAVNDNKVKKQAEETAQGTFQVDPDNLVKGDYVTYKVTLRNGTKNAKGSSDNDLTISGKPKLLLQCAHHTSLPATSSQKVVVTKVIEVKEDADGQGGTAWLAMGTKKTQGKQAGCGVFKMTWRLDKRAGFKIVKELEEENVFGYTKVKFDLIRESTGDVQEVTLKIKPGDASASKTYEELFGEKVIDLAGEKITVQEKFVKFGADDESTDDDDSGDVLDVENFTWASTHADSDMHGLAGQWKTTWKVSNATVESGFPKNMQEDDESGHRPSTQIKLPGKSSLNDTTVTVKAANERKLGALTLKKIVKPIGTTAKVKRNYVFLLKHEQDGDLISAQVTINKGDTEGSIFVEGLAQGKWAIWEYQPRTDTEYGTSDPYNYDDIDASSFQDILAGEIEDVLGYTPTLDVTAGTGEVINTDGRDVAHVYVKANDAPEVTRINADNGANPGWLWVQKICDYEANEDTTFKVQVYGPFEEGNLTDSATIEAKPVSSEQISLLVHEGQKKSEPEIVPNLEPGYYYVKEIGRKAYEYQMAASDDPTDSSHITRKDYGVTFVPPDGRASEWQYALPYDADRYDTSNPYHDVDGNLMRSKWQQQHGFFYREQDDAAGTGDTEDFANNKILIKVRNRGSYVKLRKKSIDPTVTNGHPLYNMMTTIYKAYTDETCMTPAKNLETGEDVVWISDSYDSATSTATFPKILMDYGTYYIKETQAGPGYMRDTRIIKLILKDPMPAEVDVPSENASFVNNGDGHGTGKRYNP